jgi:hypothetical protein
MKINPEFMEIKEVSSLTDYAVELRYPDDFYMPDIIEANEACMLAILTKQFVLKKINSF